jgi:LysM repeat protein
MRPEAGRSEGPEGRPLLTSEDWFPSETILGSVSGSADPGANNMGIPSTPSTHRVLAGETLSKIAQRYKTTVDAFVKTNHIPNPDLIQVGQILKIPVTVTSQKAKPAGTPPPPFRRSLSNFRRCPSSSRRVPSPRRSSRSRARTMSSRPRTTRPRSPYVLTLRPSVLASSPSRSGSSPGTMVSHCSRYAPTSWIACCSTRRC